MYRFLLVLCCLVSLQAGAQTRMVFDGCIDARGAAVPSLADPALAVAFDTRLENGAPVIRYNSSVLPGLSERARLFFYSHECARIGLGQPAGLRSVGDAWRADCRALETLQHSGLIAAQDVAALEAELQLPDAAWSVLPGPQREIRLAACSPGAAKGAPGLQATAGQDQSRWNACVHACGDTLLQCQRRTCGGIDCPACLPANDRCVAACEGRR